METRPVDSPVTVTAYKVRTNQHTRTLTSGVKYVHKRYILMYVLGGSWLEYPNPFTDRAQAIRFAKSLVSGELSVEGV